MLKRFFSLCCLFSSLSAYPAMHQLECYGGIEAGIELLYLRPAACEMTYVIDDPSSSNALDIVNKLPQGKAVGINPSYDFGFRAFAGYVFESGCSDVIFQYTALHTTSSSKRTAAPMTRTFWPTFMDPKNSTPLFINELFASASAKFDYDAIDVQIGGRMMVNCSSWLRGHIGLHYINLNHRLDIHYQEGILVVVPDSFLAFDVQDHRNVWAIGPRTGADVRINCLCGLGISGRFGVGLLVGERDGKRLETDLIIDRLEVDVDETLNVEYEHRVAFVPLIEARVGINYACECQGYSSFLVELGYEWTSYVGAIALPRFNDEGATSSTRCKSFDLDGLYLMGKFFF